MHCVRNTFIKSRRNWRERERQRVYQRVANTPQRMQIACFIIEMLTARIQQIHANATRTSIKRQCPVFALVPRCLSALRLVSVAQTHRATSATTIPQPFYGSHLGRAYALSLRNKIASVRASLLPSINQLAIRSQQFCVVCMVCT